MLRQVIFRNMDTGGELQMPVTPDSFTSERGRRVETLDMAAFGEVNVPGLLSLSSFDREFLLPAHSYPFCENPPDPWQTVEQLTRWSEAANVVRYIVYGTSVNEPCLIEAVRAEERDGTNDVYVTLSLKRYRYLSAETVENTTGNEARDGGEQNGIPEDGINVEVEEGDCTDTISAAYYGTTEGAASLESVNGKTRFPKEGSTLTVQKTFDRTALTKAISADQKYAEKLVNDKVSQIAGGSLHPLTMERL